MNIQASKLVPFVKRLIGSEHMGDVERALEGFFKDMGLAWPENYIEEWDDEDDDLVSSELAKLT